MSLLISDAFAAATNAAPTGGQGMMSSMMLLAGFMVIFYFLLIRPQAKRAKEHRNLVSALAKGDEVITNGGIVGKITKVNDDFVSLAIADGVEIMIQKQAVASVVPKGTMKAG